MSYLLALLLFTAVDPAAVVQVQDAPGPGGGRPTATATVIAISDDDTPVATLLTCAHVFGSGQPLTVDFSNGIRFRARTVVIDHDKDYAIIQSYVPRGFAATIPLGHEVPKAGEPVEVYGYPWTAQGKLVRKVLTYRGRYPTNSAFPNWIWLDPGVISGDSGGAIVYNEKVIGVVSGFQCHSGSQRPMNSHGPWTGLIDKKYTQCFGCGEGCGQQPQQMGFIGVGVGRARIPQPPQIQQQPLSSRDPELIAWMTEVRDRLAAIKPCECQGSPTAAEVAKELQPSMPTAEQISAALYKNFGDKLRGPAGPPGRDGINGSSPSTGSGITHATLVVDRSAAYWPRLSVALERARQRFNGIRIASPPEFATQLPAIVFYENGKPVLVRKGERDVTHTLTAIERGDLSFLQES